MVTGGARRIGKAIALALAAEGADIILHYHRSRTEAEEVSAQIQEMERQCRISSHNLSDSENTGSWFRELIGEVGYPDFLVNSASKFSGNTYSTMSRLDLHHSMSIHVHSPLIMMMMMHESGRDGSIVNILDTRVVDRDPVHASYHLGKLGLHTLTRDLAVEMAPGLRINAVAPGIILPPEGKDESWIERLKSTNPLMERGTVKDVCDAVLYLLGARFVTGVILYVDGGRHLKGNSYEL